MAVGSKEKIREIYEVLPKLNCGFCGFGSCGQFARAVAEGRASPFGCRQNPWCVYSKDYTCPLAPVESWLEVPTQAGEKNYVLKTGAPKIWEIAFRF